MISVLVREDTTAQESDSLVDVAELHQAAADKLGYQPLLKQGKKNEERRKLLGAINKAGVRPFTSESVESYQQAMIDQEVTSLGGILVAVMTAMLSVALAVTLSAVFDLAWWWVMWPAIVGILAALVTIGGLGMNNEIRRRGWTRTSLRRYAKPVPEFALQTALDIREQCPYAKFYVVELEETPDPFLAVTVEGAEGLVYVEVWNEPAFNAEREH
jgi:uncharacterized integral membrane protein